MSFPLRFVKKMMFVRRMTFPSPGKRHVTIFSAMATAVWVLPPPLNPDVSQTAPGLAIPSINFPNRPDFAFLDVTESFPTVSRPIPGVPERRHSDDGIMMSIYKYSYKNILLE